jgi:regulator of sigma E protease
MIDESFDASFADKEPQPYEFRAKPMWQKIFVITAGVLMNLLLAWIIFWGGNFFQGKPVTKTTTIGYIEQGSVPDSLGLKHNDKIISINNVDVNYWEDVRAELFIHTLGEDINITVERDAVNKTIFIPRSVIPDDETQIYFLLPQGTRTVVTAVMEDSPALNAGLNANDVFLEINNIRVYSPKQATEIIKGNSGTELPIVVLRGGDTLSLAVTPGEDGMIGIGIGSRFTGESYYKTSGFFESFYLGWLDIVTMTDLTFNMLGKVFTGKIEFGKAFGGPVKIAQYAAKSADSGMSSFLYFLALLSLSLAILNIMPFPVLDGGHLIIILIEGITKREIPVKIKIAIQNAGLIILLLLMAFIVYNDIISL